MKKLLVLFAAFFVSPNTTQQEPIGKVEVLHDEVEIEYVDTDIYSQWVFDTDTEILYMTFNDDGSIEYRTPNFN